MRTRGPLDPILLAKAGKGFLPQGDLCRCLIGVECAVIPSGRDHPLGWRAAGKRWCTTRKSVGTSKRLNMGIPTERFGESLLTETLRLGPEILHCVAAMFGFAWMLRGLAGAAPPWHLLMACVAYGTLAVVIFILIVVSRQTLRPVGQVSDGELHRRVFRALADCAKHSKDRRKIQVLRAALSHRGFAGLADKIIRGEYVLAEQLPWMRLASHRALGKR